jgi:histidyl-tRNA synthetase
MGDVVLTDLLRHRRLLPPFGERLDAYVLIEEEALRLESLRLIQDLRDAGRTVDYPFVPTRSDKQLKRALEQNAAFALCLQRERESELGVRVRDLKSRVERTVARSEALNALKTG